MNNLKEELVLEIIKQHFDEIPQITKYHSESSYVVELKFKEFKKILKINTSQYDWKLSKEIYIFEILKNHNIPTPEIYFINLSKSKFPQYYIMEHLGTHNLMELCNSKLPISTKMFKQMGEYFAKTHSIKFEYQGKISDKGVIKKSFYEIFKEEFEINLNNLVKLKVLSITEVKKCQELFSKFQNSNEAVLCHMDFGPWQIIINDKQNKITGLIDWEWSISSYSVADFARAETLMSIFGCRFNQFREGYEKHKKLPENFDEIKIPYKLPQLLGILYHFKISNNENNFKKCKEYFNQLIF